MAESADDLLSRARQAMTDDLYALGTGGAYVELKDAVTELDALLSAGGPLPAAWAGAGNSQLRAELLNQWEYNHYEHCSNEWPHPDGKMCHWPKPAILDRPVTDVPLEACDG